MPDRHPSYQFETSHHDWDSIFATRVSSSTFKSEPKFRNRGLGTKGPLLEEVLTFPKEGKEKNAHGYLMRKGIILTSYHELES